MKKDNAVFFEYKATVIEKENMDEEAIKSEVERTLKAYFLKGLEENFDKLPFNVTVESHINEDSKMETNYIMKLAILSQDTFEELMERQESLEFLLAKQALIKKKRTREMDSDDDWISNKKVH